MKNLIAAVLLLVCGSVQAALVNQDLYNFGDELITYDTASGLEWLDLTETRFRSYNDISSQFRYRRRISRMALCNAFGNPKYFLSVRVIAIRYGLGAIGLQ